MKPTSVSTDTIARSARENYLMVKPGTSVVINAKSHPAVSKTTAKAPALANSLQGVVPKWSEPLSVMHMCFYHASLFTFCGTY